jgi:hypothetical protein
VRRVWTFTFVGLSLSVALVSGPLAAADAPNATAPASIGKNQAFSFTIRNCPPPGREALIVFESTDNPLQPTPEERPGDADGTTEVPHSYGTAGPKTLLVRCEDLGLGSKLWEEPLTIDVVEQASTGTQASPTLTADEKKKCKRIANATKRKACLKKQAAD